METIVDELTAEGAGRSEARSAEGGVRSGIPADSAPGSRFYERVAGQLQPPFRGGAVDNLGGAPMGKGHNNENQPFDINTACYLKPVFAAYDHAQRNGLRRKIVVKAGVKTIKSFTLEVCAADHVTHRNGDTAIYFGSESAAESTATTRILDFFRGIPSFVRKLMTIVSRFDETIGAVKFPDKTLFILSANLSNTQQKNLGFAGLQDAFVTAATGMIDEMIARTTQYQDAIVFLESQGGEKGFDFDRHYDDTDQGELHVICPCCGTKHVFNWKVFDEQAMSRPDDFKAVLPRKQVWEVVRRHCGPFGLVKNYLAAKEYLKTGTIG